MNKGVMVRTRQTRPLCNCSRHSLDTPTKTQDLARQAYQSRTQFHRLFRTVIEETPEPCDDGYCWKEQHINWRVPECRSRTSPWMPTTVRWRRSLALSESFSDFSQPLPAHRVIRTFTCRRPTKFTFLPQLHQQRVHLQKE